MVIFDKGDKILKTADFPKDPALWIYQLKNAETVPDRADAAVALGAVRNNSAAVAALADSAQHDCFWGARAESLKALAKIGGPDAQTAVLAGLNDRLPWVRDVAARVLGRFKGDSNVASTLTSTASGDPAYRVRAGRASCACRGESSGRIRRTQRRGALRFARQHAARCRP